jgi:hypothetical protein
LDFFRSFGIGFELVIEALGEAGDVADGGFFC